MKMIELNMTDFFVIQEEGYIDKNKISNSNLETKQVNGVI